MTKTPPSREKTVFLLCEDIRQELGGKFSLLGLVANNDISVDELPPNVGEGGAAIPSLTILFLFRDGEGEFNAKVGVIGPDNKELVPENGTTMKKGPKETMNVGFKITPFKVMVGKYRAYVLLDNERYEEEFVIRGKKP
jgi:hypothetical protein